MVVQRSIDIDAPASTVWAVVSDVERWPEWTASISSAKRSRTGPLAVGERVVVTQPRLPTLTYTVTEVDEGRCSPGPPASAPSAAAHADDAIMVEATDLGQWRNDERFSNITTYCSCAR